ncbi:MAG: putative DNA-binding domain-containing protein [Sphingomonadales bacterium]|jgi:hypothetical protein
MLADTAAHTPAGFEAWYAGLLLGDAVPDAPALQLALRVHANNALAAATDALASNFPVLGAMLGADAFAALALRHARAHPPTDPRLCLYGKGLDNSIAAAAELADWPWLADMARLEWLVVQALFAADPPGRPRRLAAGDSWPLAPATRWLSSAWPIASLWQAHQPGAAWPDDFKEAGELALISRVHGQVRVMALPCDALPLLAALRQRTPLDRLDAGLLAHLPALAGAGALVPALFPVAGDI